MAHFGHGNDRRGDQRDHRRDSDYDRRASDRRDAPGYRAGGGDGYYDGHRESFHSRGGDDRSRFEAAQHSGGPRSRSRSRSPRRVEDRRQFPDQESHRQTGQREGFAGEPSATLIVRGLTPRVSDAMMYQAVEAHRPASVRVMVHKVTGEPRGFGFINFTSVEAAVEVMRVYAHHPLVLDHQPVALAYADSNRPTAAGLPHGQQGPPRLDWICDQCGSSNFARRTACFKCHVPKSQFAMEVPAQPPVNRQAVNSSYAPPFDPQQRHDFHGGAQDIEEPPSNVLVVRMIPFDVEEMELRAFFAQFDGLQDVRLIRDRETNQSRGFAFIDFVDINAAQYAKDNSSTQLLRGEQIWVGFARESFRAKPPSRFDRPAVPLNPIAAAALEQAQWALGNGYGTAYQAQQQQDQLPQQDDTPVGLDDLDALLGNAAAAARPHIDEPKKPWPLPFEKAGGMYTYVSQYGLYYDTDSMFYYDPQSKLYYNSFMGVYYRCSNGESFEAYSPPVPVDDATFTDGSAAAASTQPPPTAKPIAMSLAKKKDKKPLIAFSLKAPSSGLHAAPPVSGFDAPAPVPTPPPTGLGTGVSIAAAASASVRKKSAQDIAKWSQRQQHKDAVPVETTATEPQAGPSTSSVAAVVELPVEAPICLLCRRKFASIEQLRKHEAVSKLHAENLAKAKQDKAVVAAQVRERDEEEHQQQKALQQHNLKRPRTDSEPATAASSTEPAPSSLESGMGAKMLKMMGWKHGEGLGKHGTGITAPVQASGHAGSETIGLGARTAPSVDLSDVASYKERLQRMARARYDNAQDPL